MPELLAQPQYFLLFFFLFHLIVYRWWVKTCSINKRHFAFLHIFNRNWRQRRLIVHIFRWIEIISIKQMKLPIVTLQLRNWRKGIAFAWFEWELLSSESLNFGNKFRQTLQKLLNLLWISSHQEYLLFDEVNFNFIRFFFHSSASECKMDFMKEKLDIFPFYSFFLLNTFFIRFLTTDLFVLHFSYKFHIEFCDFQLVCVFSEFSDNFFFNISNWKLFC